MMAFLLTLLYITCGVLSFWLACKQQARNKRRIDRRTLKEFMFWYGLIWPVGACVIAFICVITIWNGFCEYILDMVNEK